MVFFYILLLVLAVFFKVMHFPGTALLFVVSTLFPIIDLLIQVINQKENRKSVVLSSVVLVSWSVFIVAKFLKFAGANYLLFFNYILTLIYFFQLYKKNYELNTRSVLIALVCVFGIFNSVLKPSTFTILYSKEDPFDPKSEIPHYILQKLAYDLYVEGKPNKAAFLIQRNILHIEHLLKSSKGDDTYYEIDMQNLEQSRNDSTYIRENKWETFVPLFPEDRFVK